MECMYSTQGEYLCKKIEDSKRVLFIQPDKCEFIKTTEYNKNYEDAAKFDKCPKTCELNGSLYSGIWTKKSCKCCKQ